MKRNIKLEMQRNVEFGIILGEFPFESNSEVAVQKKQQPINQNTAQKMKFSLRISPVNVTKSTGNCGFGHIYWRNP